MYEYLKKYGFKVGDTVRLVVDSFADTNAHVVIGCGFYKAEDITELPYQLGNVVHVVSPTLPTKSSLKKESE